MRGVDDSQDSQTQDSLLRGRGKVKWIFERVVAQLEPETNDFLLMFWLYNIHFNRLLLNKKSKNSSLFISYFSIIIQQHHPLARLFIRNLCEIL